MEIEKEQYITVSDSSGVGYSRRMALQWAKFAGFKEAESGKIAIVATELATNVLKHGQNGELLFQVLSTANIKSGLDILALDRGNGIKNVSQALKDGYSSSGTMGTGLGAVSRLSNTFDVFSSPGLGTVVFSRFYKEGQEETRGEKMVGGIGIPKAGEKVSGDAWMAIEEDGREKIIVVDGLGHGSMAAEAAGEALACFDQNRSMSPSSLMNTLHARLAGTRGAAGVVLDFDCLHNVIRYSGVGNITGVLCSTRSRRAMISYNGTLGYSLHKIQEIEYEVHPDTVLVLHSDGLSSHWGLEKYPGLQRKHPTLIAGVLYRDYAKHTDDVTVVVAKFRESQS